MADNVYNNDINLKKIFVMNGSFKKEESGTLRVTKAFLKGVQNVLAQGTLDYLQVPMLDERRFKLAINKFWQDEEAAGKAQRKEN